jgi:hypothetical protein
MGPNFSDLIRKDYKGYMEPLLLTACDHEAEKLGITRSKFIRYAVIKLLIEKKYPLKDISNKFNDFYKGITYNQ